MIAFFFFASELYNDYSNVFCTKRKIFESGKRKIFVIGVIR